MATRSSSSSSSSSSWIPPPIRQDFEELRQRRVPAHIEVSLRVAASALMAYIFGLASLPNVFPASQRYTIAMGGPMASLLLPTLLFSILGALVPQLPIIIGLGLVVATALLASATVSLRLYVALFGVTVTLLARLRFQKSTASFTTVLIMFIALNTQGFALAADEAGSLDFVKSLWTETGLQNPQAVFTNTLVAFLWICAAVTLGRVLPPFCTVRKMMSREIVPAALRTTVEWMQMRQEQLQRDPQQEPTTKEVQEAEDGDILEQPREKNNTSPSEEKTIQQQQQLGALERQLWHYKAVLADGSLAVLTACEPRLFRLAPPECSWMVLKELMVSVNHILLATLCMSINDADEDILVVLEHQSPEDATETITLQTQLLTDTAQALEQLEYSADNLPQSALRPSNSNAKEEDVTFPAYFAFLNQQLTAATQAWIQTMGPPDRSQSYFDEKARTALRYNLMPIWKSSGYSYLKGMLVSVWSLLHLATWRRMVLGKDFAKFVWCLKFGIGFAALVCLYVYWPEYRELEIPSSDVGEQAHAAGWILIAYAMAATPTAEGTVKKGLLRLLGTAVGGFSGWLALVASEDNVYGLITWMTVTTILAAYVGLRRGNLARMGVSPDYGYGPAVFCLTQGLVVSDVYIGNGGRNDITVNRIVGNCIGISMAILLAFVPPSLYGGNPKYVWAVWNEERRILVECLERLLEFCQARQHQTNSSTISLTAAEQQVIGVCKELNLIRANSPLKAMLEEADDYLTDASQLSRFPLLKVDPMLSQILSSLKILGSDIETCIGYATHVLLPSDDDGDDNQPSLVGARFLSDAKSSQVLRELINELNVLLPEVEEKESPTGYLLDSLQEATTPRNTTSNSSDQGEKDEGLSMSLESKLFLSIIRKMCSGIRLNQERFRSMN